MGKLGLGLAGVVAGLVAACGGDEFSEASGTGGASSGGASGGGASSGGASNGGSGGAPAGGAAGTGGSTAGAGGGGGSGAAGGGGAGGGGAAGGAGGSGAAGGAGGAGGSGGALPAGCGNAHPNVALLYTTLNDTPAITSPAVIKNGVGQQIGGQFAEGMCASQAFRVNGTGQLLKFPASQNINLVSGTLDFWFRPLFQKDDGQSHRLIGNPLIFQLVKSTQNDLVFGMGSTPLATVASANLPFVQNQWVRITVVWKTTVADMTQIYFNGVGAALQSSKAGPFTPPAITSEDIWVGAFISNDQNHANGVFDDLKIYDGTEPP